MSDPIVLPARLDVTTVGDLAIVLRQAAEAGSIRIEASEVTHMGALGTQLLLSTARAVRAQGGKMDVVDMPDRAQEQLAAMGLTPEMLEEGAT